MPNPTNECQGEWRLAYRPPTSEADEEVLVCSECGERLAIRHHRGLTYPRDLTLAECLLFALLETAVLQGEVSMPANHPEAPTQEEG